MTCVGAACGAVEIVWNEAACEYRIVNRCARRVRVVVSTISGSLIFRLEPQSAATLDVAQFELPYEANYID